MLLLKSFIFENRLSVAKKAIFSIIILDLNIWQLISNVIGSGVTREDCI